MAEAENDATYHEVVSTGLGKLLCLGGEFYGRWGRQALWIVPELAFARTRGMHARVRKGATLGLLHRWWGLLGLALQEIAARAVLHDFDDLPATLQEAAPGLADLEIV